MDASKDFLYGCMKWTGVGFRYSRTQNFVTEVHGTHIAMAITQLSEAKSVYDAFMDFSVL